MATKSQKKASKLAAQSLASPALRQTLMDDANASTATAATRPSTPRDLQQRNQRRVLCYS